MTPARLVGCSHDKSRYGTQLFVTVAHRESPQLFIFISFLKSHTKYYETGLHGHPNLKELGGKVSLRIDICGKKYKCANGNPPSLSSTSVEYTT